MHGRGVKQAVRGMIVLLLAAAPGCGDARPQPPTVEPAPEGGDLFDPDARRHVRGRVVWKGDCRRCRRSSSARAWWRRASTRNRRTGPIRTPRTSMGRRARSGGRSCSCAASTRAAAGRGTCRQCASSSRGGSSTSARETRDGSVGFVRRGDAVEMVSADTTFYSLHAGGAAFFTLAFPDPDRPRTRRLESRGVVELSSAAGASGCAATSSSMTTPITPAPTAEGRFRLTGVPPGRYEVVCWLPDWREERHERDPETSLVTRVYFRPPLESVRPVQLEAKGTLTTDFDLAHP